MGRPPLLSLIIAWDDAPAGAEAPALQAALDVGRFHAQAVWPAETSVASPEGLAALAGLLLHLWQQSWEAGECDGADAGGV